MTSFKLNLSRRERVSRWFKRLWRNIDSFIHPFRSIRQELEYHHEWLWDQWREQSVIADGAWELQCRIADLEEDLEWLEGHVGRLRGELYALKPDENIPFAVEGELSENVNGDRLELERQLELDADELIYAGFGAYHDERFIGDES